MKIYNKKTGQEIDSTRNDYRESEVIIEIETGIITKYGLYSLLKRNNKYYYAQKDINGSFKMPLWSGGGVNTMEQAKEKLKDFI